MFRLNPISTSNTRSLPDLLGQLYRAVAGLGIPEMPDGWEDAAAPELAPDAGHPHRRPLRERRRVRAGSVSPAPQTCLVPLRAAGRRAAVHPVRQLGDS